MKNEKKKEAKMRSRKRKIETKKLHKDSRDEESQDAKRIAKVLKERVGGGVQRGGKEKGSWGEKRGQGQGERTPARGFRFQFHSWR